MDQILHLFADIDWSLVYFVVVSGSNEIDASVFAKSSPFRVDEHLNFDLFVLINSIEKKKLATENQNPVEKAKLI